MLVTASRGLILLRFHLHSGARVATRTLAPLAAGATAAAVIMGNNPLLVLAPFATVLFPPGASASAAIAAACMLVGTAAALAARLRVGLAGWIRHLPASAAERRRAAAAGLAIATSPVVLLTAAAGLTTLHASPVVTTVRLVGLPVAALAAACVALPVGAPSRVLAGLSAALSFAGSPWALITGVAVLVAADRQAREIHSKPAGTRRRVMVWSPRGSLLWMLITLRALGMRLFGFCLTSVFILIPLLLFVSNNGLTGSQSNLAVRFAGLTAASFVAAAVADGLAKRRPPWPWARSLPWSATRRVTLDALVVGGAALPAILAAGVIRPAALPSMLIVLPILALRSAAATRSAPGRATGASGQIIAEGCLMAAATAVLPAVTLFAIPATPLALKMAANSEKNQDVSRWHELHHLAVGDSTSWSNP